VTHADAACAWSCDVGKLRQYYLSTEELNGALVDGMNLIDYLAHLFFLEDKEQAAADPQ